MFDFTLQGLKNEHARKMVSLQRHISAPLTIYNYTARCQYTKCWNFTTLAARGLILDDNYNVVARGFRKFFNYGEMPNDIIPHVPFRVFDKKDGSMGLLYLINGEPFIATRGSFDGPQAVRATSIFKKKYKDYRPPEGTTAIFEVIYPENKIVVDYGDTEDLFHLALVDNKTGLPLFDLDRNWPGPAVQEFSALSVDELRKQIRPNAEGFVVRFHGGHQIKIKLEEYLRLHKSMFQTSTKSIWEHLMNGTEDELYQNTPDELYFFIKEHSRRLLLQYREKEEQAKKKFEEIKSLAEKGRREFAMEAMKFDLPSVLFALLDNKSYSEIIWKKLEPEYIPARVAISESVA